MESPSNNLGLKLLFTILVVAVLGELVFIYFDSRKNSPSVMKTKISNSIPTPEPQKPTPKPTASKVDFNSCINMLNDYYFDRSNISAINSANYYLENKLANSSHIVTELQGQIVSFDREVSREVPTNITSEFYIKFKREVNGKQQTFDIVFDSNLLTKTKVADSSGVIISYKDLKVGQTVIMTKTYDLEKNIFSSIDIKILDK